MQILCSLKRGGFFLLLFLGWSSAPISALAEDVAQEELPNPSAFMEEKLHPKDFQSPEVKTLKTLRKTIIPLHYQNVPLDQVLNHLQMQSPVPIHPLWDILEQEFDIHRKLPITLHQPNPVSLDTALHALVEYLSAHCQEALTISVVAGEVYIGPEEELPEKYFSILYYVGDLVCRSLKNGQGYQEEKFAELIQELEAELKTYPSAQESKSKGGVDSIQALPPNRLAITQTYPNHCRIAQWFQDKRLSLGKQVALEIRIVKVVGRAVKENLPDIYQHLSQPNKKMHPTDFFPLKPAKSKNIQLSGYGLGEKQLELLLRSIQTNPPSRFLDAPHVTVFDGEQAELRFSVSYNPSESPVNDITMDFLPNISTDKRYVRLDTHIQMSGPPQKVRRFQAQCLIPDEQHIILAVFKTPFPLESAPSRLQQSRMNGLIDVFAQKDTDLDKLFTILICKPRIILPQPYVQKSLSRMIY